METQIPEKARSRRPDFLTVLCILTFLGSSFGLINAVTNYINADVLTELGKEGIEKSKEQVNSELSGSEHKIADKVLSGASAMLDPVKLKQNYLLSFVSNLLTLAGGFLMFRLRKTGFWLYVAGTAILVVTPVVIFGASNILSLGIMLGYGVIGILFIILYYLNLKHMA